MPLTLANIEAVLLRRVGKLLAAAELDATTSDGTNADLVDPIAWALRHCGMLLASPLAATDSELAQLEADRLDELLDYAELRTLETITTSLDDVDLTVGPRSERFSQLVAQVERALERKRSMVQRRYGVDVGTISSGSLLLGIAQQYPLSPSELDELDG